MKLGGKTKYTSPKYVIDISELNLLSLGELREGVLIRKNEKNLGFFNLRTGDHIFIKFDI